MKIRKVLASDLDAVMEIVDAARGIMRASGNILQWTGGYPNKISLFSLRNLLLTFLFTTNLKSLVFYQRD